MLGCEDEVEAGGPLGRDPGLGFLADMRGMIVEDPLDGGFFRIGFIETAQKGDELARAMALLDERMNLAAQIAVVSLGNGLESLVPDTYLAPPDEAVVAGRVRALTPRNVGTKPTRAQPPIDAVRDLAVIGVRHAPRLVGQQGRDDRPLKIRQLIAARRHASSSKELELGFARQGNPLYEFLT